NADTTRPASAAADAGFALDIGWISVRIGQIFRRISHGPGMLIAVVRSTSRGPVGAPAGTAGRTGGVSTTISSSSSAPCASTASGSSTVVGLISPLATVNVASRMAARLPSRMSVNATAPNAYDQNGNATNDTHALVIQASLSSCTYHTKNG